jgi:hypothetical protein|tara:strand:- start:26016 stop:26453 length:438 start_codon:yes stop_codon:yes gene_type:complete
MKAQGFVKLLRKVIREEVRNVIVKELKPILNEVNINKHNTNLQEIADVPNTKTKPVMKKQYTKNTALNDILNETAATPPGEWNSVNFRSDMAEAFGMQTSDTPLATKGINGESVDMSNEAVASTVSAMTKDYSALMKAIDKKKGI